METGLTDRPSRETIGERRRTHGQSNVEGRPTPTYVSWAAMKARCLNPDCPGFEAYGAAGITVCERWHSFENFLADMGERPAGMSIDRYPDRAGNYEPGNCRWATNQEQGRNRDTSRAVIRDDGLRFPSIIEAAEATGSSRWCIGDTCRGKQKSHLCHGWSYAK